MACNGFADLLPLTASGHSSRANKLGCRRPPLTLRSCGCIPSNPSPLDSHRGRIGRLRTTQEIKTMAQIGTFTRDEAGAYTGTIKTLTLNVKASIKPCDRDNERAPDFRVTAGGVEFGAGWSRTARVDGRRIPLAQARRSVLHGARLRLPRPGRQGRAQAHLVPLTSSTALR
jgi:hypothetical protein